MDDAQRLFAWRDDPETRAASVHTGPLDWDLHVGWLERSLRRDDRVLLIGEIEGAALGVIRFDEVAPGEWEIGIMLDREARGRGVGGRLLRAGLARLGEERSYLARVREENERSRRLFEGAGFVERGRGEGFVFYGRARKAAA
jgi:RimJ/RimL family protein N-acetyltransferase